jgi:hypothetical protein
MFRLKLCQLRTSELIIFLKDKKFANVNVNLLTQNPQSRQTAVKKGRKAH